MTDLEKILSNIVNRNVKLIDFRQTTSCSMDLGPEFIFELTAVPDKDCEGYVCNDDIPFCDLDCCDCDLCQEECFDCETECDCELEFEEEDPMMWGIPDVDRIIFNSPATIVFWDDGTKTVVKCMEDQPYEKYAGFAMACMKKMFGSTSRAKAIMNECDMDNYKPVSEPKPEPKKTEQKPKEYDSNPQLTKFICNAFKDLAKAIAGEASKEKKDEAPAE